MNKSVTRFARRTRPLNKEMWKRRIGNAKAGCFASFQSTLHDYRGGCVASKASQTLLCVQADSDSRGPGWDLRWCIASVPPGLVKLPVGGAHCLQRSRRPKSQLCLHEPCGLGWVSLWVCVLIWKTGVVCTKSLNTVTCCLVSGPLSSVGVCVEVWEKVWSSKMFIAVLFVIVRNKEKTK